jgi:hypothetical protein
MMELKLSSIIMPKHERYLLLGILEILTLPANPPYLNYLISYPGNGMRGSLGEAHCLWVLIKKQKRDNIPDVDEPRTTRGIRTNYWFLNDPFTDDFAGETFITAEEVYAIVARDEITNLKEAKNSPDWPKWKEAIKDELNQLDEMGTWKLVPKPQNAVLITNKWVFICQRNKEGNIVKHKAWLVARGCTQCPGYDFVETFAPVIWIDTLCTILALVPLKKLKIQQIDVKGAYLNGILKEKIYMRQPEGHNDGTGRICQLHKTIYGLWQAGHKWNKQVDERLRKHGYTPLGSDPCIYVRWDSNNFSILTIWVDDILLFTSSDKMMDQMKDVLWKEWTMTDLGDPTKIVGIKIMHKGNSIFIFQQKYIEGIL